MKIKLTEEQLKRLTEKVNSKGITCDVCGWYWEWEVAGDDPLTCHKCGHINE